MGNELGELEDRGELDLFGGATLDNMVLKYRAISRQSMAGYRIFKSSSKKFLPKKEYFGASKNANAVEARLKPLSATVKLRW